MKILVDTGVWSEALRRKSKENEVSHVATTLIELIEEQRVEIIGPIRQELLSGIRIKHHYLALRDKLRNFTDIILLSRDYERAAEMSNICRSEGIQGSPTDFLICSVSERHHLSIFTMDRDFSHYAKHLPILLFPPQAI
ncbi:MAG: PIN domain-containing protein [Parachlamydiaceae bacterium]|nr:PIN domain-containing protein [Parachlamydiaceae bacterium]